MSAVGSVVRQLAFRTQGAENLRKKNSSLPSSRDERYDCFEQLAAMYIAHVFKKLKRSLGAQILPLLFAGRFKDLVLHNKEFSERKFCAVFFKSLQKT